MPLPEAIARDTAASPRWLSIVGIGEDGIDGLSAAARGLIGAAEIVFGGRRHLSLAAPLIRGAARPWPSPFDGAADEVLQHRGRQICVLASGDPFHYGVGTVLAQRIDAREMIVVPAPSAFSLAAARLGWSLPQTVLLSVHGRTLDLDPAASAARRADSRSDLRRRGTGGLGAAARRKQASAASRLTVLEALGGPRERVRATMAAAFEFGAVDRAQHRRHRGRRRRRMRASSRARRGLADDLFEHDGQITKREVRAVTLSSLAPRRGELLWDIGAGSGSVAIEWLLADPSDARDRRRTARRPRRAHPPQCRRLRRAGARNHGRRRARRACRACRTPDAVFIGGGAGDPGVLDAAIAALRARRPARGQCGDA